jgi:hypothetical protein
MNAWIARTSASQYELIPPTKGFSKKSQWLCIHKLVLHKRHFEKICAAGLY